MKVFGLVAVGLFFGLMGVSSTLPHEMNFFHRWSPLKCRCWSPLSACQQNQVKIDGALQQLMIDGEFETQKEAVDWAISEGGIDSMVGDKNYLRTTPTCPEKGTYQLVATKSGPTVRCTNTKHPYPGPVQPVAAASGSAIPETTSDLTE